VIKRKKQIKLPSSNIHIKKKISLGTQQLIAETDDLKEYYTKRTN